GDGKYLFFVSDRDFNPQYSHTEWNHAYQDMGRIYVVTLARETPSPFAPESDEVGTPAKPGKSPSRGRPEGKPGKKKSPMPGTGNGSAVKDLMDNVLAQAVPAAKVKVDLEGIGDRVLQLPVPPGMYHNLQSVGSTVYYLRSARKKEGGL